MSLSDTCPAPSARQLRRSDELVLPMQKSVIVQYALGDTGARELRLYHRAREIAFDEPDLFAFGERLAASPSFTAAEAAGWGGPHAWDRVRPLLEELIGQGVLAYADEIGDLPRLALRPEERPSPLPPAATAIPRDWRDAEAVMADLTGQPLEAGWLELVVPIFRLAHPALDADGRQVGEGNVFPKALRLDTPTAWRTCIYPGSRYQAERPMNATALKAMMTYWGQMMTVLARVREAYLARFPAAREGWTVAHVERLATCVLALPTYLVMRAEQPVGRLHPALSSLFRVTDGLRLLMHQMLFVPIGEAAWAADAPVTAAEIHAYAERNYSFHSDHGVCAGPKIMVEEFLAVLLDGRPPRIGAPAELDADVAAAVGEIEAAMAYGFLGLQAYAAIFSLWPAMTRGYEALHGEAAALAATGSSAAAQWAERLAGHVEQIRHRSYLGTEPLRRQRDAAYGDMYAQCGLALGELEAGPLSERLAPIPLPEPARRRLREALAGRMAASLDAVEPLSVAIEDYLGRTQAVLRAGCEVQGRINRHLGRRSPERAFDAFDLDLHNKLLGETDRRLPYLLDELQTLIGLRISLKAGGLEFGEARTDG